MQAPGEMGRRIAERYVTEALIGSGAFGNVYRAKDEMLGRTVAFWVATRKAALQQISERFPGSGSVPAGQHGTYVWSENYIDARDIRWLYYIVFKSGVQGAQLFARSTRETAWKVVIDDLQVPDFVQPAIEANARNYNLDVGSESGVVAYVPAGQPLQLFDVALNKHFELGTPRVPYIPVSVSSRETTFPAVFIRVDSATSPVSKRPRPLAYVYESGKDPLPISLESRFILRVFSDGTQIYRDQSNRSIQIKAPNAAPRQLWPQ